MWASEHPRTHVVADRVERIDLGKLRGRLGEIELSVAALSRKS